jgi:hypothetical protein
MTTGAGASMGWAGVLVALVTLASCGRKPDPPPQEVIRRHSGEGAAPEVERAEVASPPTGSLDVLLDPHECHVADNGSKKAGAAAGHPLPKIAIVAGMNLVKPKIAACYSEFKMPGVAMVKVVIAQSGSVTSATVVGNFEGTPTGACVERAVETARFPPSDGVQTPYAFQLK